MTEKNRIGPWQIRSQKSVYTNPWIEIVHHEVVHPAGTDGIYGVVRFANLAVGVLPIDDAGRVPLVGQHRFPHDRYSWELPEGGVPHNELPLEGAKRELLEETGLVAAHWSPLVGADLSNSVTDERAVCFLAHGLEAAPDAPREVDPSEALTLAWTPFRILLERVMTGEITDSLTVMMVLMARERGLRGALPEAISRHVVDDHS